MYNKIINKKLIKSFVDEHCLTAEDFGTALKIRYKVYKHQCVCRAMCDALMQATKAFDCLRIALLENDITLIIKRREY